MTTASNSVSDVASASKRFVRHLLEMGANRVQLLMVELEEERESFLLAIGLALGATAFGLLAGIAFTLAIVVLFWEHSPLAALLVLTVLYVSIALALYCRMIRLRREWQPLPTTLEQIRKDRECLDRTLE